MQQSKPNSMVGTTLPSAPPEAPGPYGGSIVPQTITLTNWIFRSVAINVGSMTALALACQTLAARLGITNYWITAAIIGIPFVIVFFCFTLPEYFRRRAGARLLAIAVLGQLVRHDYFQLTPREARDQDFKRADGAHEKAVCWLREAREPILFLTGLSGTGKSSLLFAWVLPQLEEASPPTLVVRVRTSGDPAAALRRELSAHQLMSGDAPLTPATLEQATRQTNQRLLLIFDQFEEFLILREAQDRAAFTALLRDLAAQPIAGLAAVLVMRSDYLAALEDLALPPLIQGQNWMEIGPFTVVESLQYLEGGGLSLSAGLKDAILREAESIEETTGLMRPITVNFFGMLLLRFGEQLPKRYRSGALLTEHIRAVLRTGTLREDAPAILGHMITDASSKQACPLDLLARLSRKPRTVVRGVLITLANEGLVRPLDARQETWEISHDFIARLLGRVLARWYVSAWRTMRPRLAYAGLAAWAVGLSIIGTYYVQNRETVLLGQLSRLGLQGNCTPDCKLQVVTSEIDDRKLADKAVPLLIQLGSRLQSLNLGGTRITNLEPLSKLSNLQSLYLYGTGVTNFEPLSKLSSLQSLDLHGAGTTNLEPLSKLTSLQSLDLSGGRYRDNLEPLRKLSKLQLLDVSGTRVSNLGPLSQLSNLRSLNLSGTAVYDLEPLRKLANLRSLNLWGTGATNLEPLSGLLNIQTLNLSGNGQRTVELLSKLTNLQSLELSGTDVTNLELVSKFSNLQLLGLANTGVTDLELLSKLSKLQSLDVSFTGVTNLEPLRKLANLVSLNLSNTHVTNLEPLSELLKIQSLNLAYDHPLAGVEVLRKFSDLQFLDIRCTGGLDLEPLKVQIAAGKLKIQRGC